jgi:hypothetical protein
MTGDEYFVRLLHKRSDDCGLPFSFLRQCAILSSCENPERGWASETYKLFIDGKSVHGESGHVEMAEGCSSMFLFANIPFLQFRDLT